MMRQLRRFVRMALCRAVNELRWHVEFSVVCDSQGRDTRLRADAIGQTKHSNQGRCGGPGPQIEDRSGWGRSRDEL